MTTISLPAGFTWGLDCIAANVSRIPARPPVLWPYCTGTPDVEWTVAQRQEFPAAVQYLVNQGFGNPGPLAGDELDIEAHAWTPDQVVGAVTKRRSTGQHTRLYGTWDVYADVVPRLAIAGLRSSTSWRIAHWSGDIGQASRETGADVYAVQFAAPNSHPQLVIPGTNVTLAQTQCDITVIRIA